MLENIKFYMFITISIRSISRDFATTFFSGVLIEFIPMIKRNTSLS